MNNNKKIWKNYFAKKRFGQNFLVNKNFIEKIVTILNVKSHQTIIEIGPGLGSLTIPVSKHVNKIIAIEIDHNLALHLKNHKKLQKKLIMIRKDIMKINFNLIGEKGKSFRIFGNIPYNISIPIMFHLLSYIDSIYDIHFMVQEEVANRLLAKPNKKNYGKLSIIMQYFYKIIPFIKVPPSSFIPKPKVNSQFLQFIPHKKKLYPICNYKILNFILNKAFNQRRKTIQNSLKGLFEKKDFYELNIDPNNRPENLSIKNYCKLTNKFNKNNINFYNQNLIK